MNKFKDTDLREALLRKYSDTPQLPADFMANMEERLTFQPVAKTKRLWHWMAAAACLLLIVGIGVTLMPTEQQTKLEAIVAIHVDTMKDALAESVQTFCTNSAGGLNKQCKAPALPSQVACTEKKRERQPEKNVR